MAIEVFNRYENKYLLSLWELERVEAVVQYRMALDAYNQGQSTYSITNLYYDTPTNGLIRASLQKPKYKEKLRLRAYGVPQGPQQRFYPAPQPGHAQHLLLDELPDAHAPTSRQLQMQGSLAWVSCWQKRDSARAPARVWE